MVCKQCPKRSSGKMKHVPNQYKDAHAEWHKRGKKIRRVRVRNAETAKNLRLSRARRKTAAR